jgi:hypothetical protein
MVPQGLASRAGFDKLSLSGVGLNLGKRMGSWLAMGGTWVEL